MSHAPVEIRYSIKETYDKYENTKSFNSIIEIYRPSWGRNEPFKRIKTDKDRFSKHVAEMDAKEAINLELKTRLSKVPKGLITVRKVG